MLLSARAAARVLAEAGVTRNQARRLLAAGFAGPATAAAGALLHDEARVSALAARPRVDVAGLDARCPGGVLTVRRDVDVTAPRAEQIEKLRSGWPVSLATLATLRYRIQRHGHVCLVAVTGGFVSLGADLVGIHLSLPQPDRPQARSVDLELVDPGPWFEDFRDRRWWSGPGRTWSLTGWDRSSGATRPALDGPALQE